MSDFGPQDFGPPDVGPRGAVEQFLRGLLIDLERRATTLEERVEAIDMDTKPELREHALLAYRYLEFVRREAAQLVQDPSLGNPQLIKNQLQLYKRWSEVVSLVEWFPIPFIERYTQADQILTRLCHQIAREVRWPLPYPVVASFSNQYFWTKPEFNIIGVPTEEGFNILALPDLCHEMAHILALNSPNEFAGDFLTDLADHFQQELLRIDREQQPAAYKQLFSDLLALWKDVWVWEFASDMVATYLTGAPFGWQHLRLSASSGGSVYFPALGVIAEHPADEARMQGILSVLIQLGAVQQAADIRQFWDQYLDATGDVEPQEYGVCYPGHLVERLAENVIRGCEEQDLRRFDEQGGEAVEIIPMIEEGWRRFLQEPDEFGAWEGGILGELRRNE